MKLVIFDVALCCNMKLVRRLGLEV